MNGSGYGESCDWWSFGVMLYEMLVGSIYLFLGKCLEATFAQHAGIAKCPDVVYFSNLKIHFESIFAIL